MRCARRAAGLRNRVERTGGRSVSGGMTGALLPALDKGDGAVRVAPLPLNAATQQAEISLGFVEQSAAGCCSRRVVRGFGHFIGRSPRGRLCRPSRSPAL
jgi:hypothetical protein